MSSRSNVYKGFSCHKFKIIWRSRFAHLRNWMSSLAFACVLRPSASVLHALRCLSDSIFLAIQWMMRWFPRWLMVAGRIQSHHHNSCLTAKMFYPLCNLSDLRNLKYVEHSFVQPGQFEEFAHHNSCPCAKCRNIIHSLQILSKIVFSYHDCPLSQFSCHAFDDRPNDWPVTRMSFLHFHIKIAHPHI
jgi:hypothetical protein